MLLDYALPRADSLPLLQPRSAACDQPPSGCRAGRGRHHARAGGGCNAIVDALAEFGVEHIEPPATR